METFEFSKFLAGLVYVVVMELLFSNIVSGIMIDTFAELRDRKKQIVEDMKNMCFICGMSRSQADKKNKDFDAHIKNEHFLWNYIFYIYCLRNKDETDYTGIEYSIAEKLDKEDLSWIPIEEECADEETGKEEDSAEPYFEQIRQKLQTLEHRGWLDSFCHVDQYFAWVIGHVFDELFRIEILQSENLGEGCAS